MSETRTAPRGGFLAALAARREARAHIAVVEREPVTVPTAETPTAYAPLPASRPLDRSVAAGAADPIFVAEACANAGFPELTARLLQQRVTAAAVEGELERVRGIQAIARSFALPEMADAAIRGGVGLETFRALLAAAKAPPPRTPFKVG